MGPCSRKFKKNWYSLFGTAHFISACVESLSYTSCLSSVLYNNYHSLHLGPEIFFFWLSTWFSVWTYFSSSFRYCQSDEIPIGVLNLYCNLRTQAKTWCLVKVVLMTKLLLNTSDLISYSSLTHWVDWLGISLGNCSTWSF